MDEQLEHQLVTDYPEIFSIYTQSPSEIKGPPPQLALYGFECGDGWYSLIDVLCDALTTLGVTLQVVQVKEKYGRLRFYHTGITADREEREYIALGMIEFAKEVSETICERCGDHGKLRGDTRRMRTLCDDCFKEQN